MLFRVYVLQQIANETLKRTNGGQISGLDPEDANKQLLLIGATTPTESNDQQQVSIRLISIHWRFSVQLMTPTSQFTSVESNGLVYKPHQGFLAWNLHKKVQLIHESLWYCFPVFYQA